jgi:hypothetical protein
VVDVVIVMSDRDIYFHLASDIALQQQIRDLIAAALAAPVSPPILEKISTESNSSLSTGIVVGGAVGGTSAGLILIAVPVCLIIRRRDKKKREEERESNRQVELIVPARQERGASIKKSIEADTETVSGHEYGSLILPASGDLIELRDEWVIEYVRLDFVFGFSPLLNCFCLYRKI